MADQGSIGFADGGAVMSGHLLPIKIAQLMLDNEVTPMGAKDTTDGSPAQPSLRMDGQGKLTFRWHVLSGARTIQISCKQAVNLSPRPTLVVKANPAIGVNADVTATAGASTGWVTVGPATINPSSNGAVWVELNCNYSSQVGITPCYWDHIQAT